MAFQNKSIITRRMFVKGVAGTAVCCACCSLDSLAISKEIKVQDDGPRYNLQPHADILRGMSCLHQ
jgi:hypothetical protein